MAPSTQDKWLMVFYSLPSKPVSKRMKLWRKLSKVGAIQLKGAVYILPYSEEHYELFQWIISEVVSMGGDGSFVRTGGVETMEDTEIRKLFNQQREREYRAVDKKLDDLERKIQSIRKGTKTLDAVRISEAFNRLKKEFGDIQTIDFFSSEVGEVVSKRIRTTETGLKEMKSSPKGSAVAMSIAPKRVEEYRGRVWVTRKKPFVDRMASAWLIRRFIDKNATFQFIDERELNNLGKEAVVFDMREGDFTHQGDLCTFEVLMKTFGVKDKSVKKMAELVHDLDIKDGKYDNPETSGVEEILSGIRKTAKDSAETIEKGMAVFEMLYASKNS
jgi:hypothetical protein